MAEALLTGSIQAPGFSGLDIQDASVQLSSGYALEAFNCVIDKYGRIGARKGWTKVNTTSSGSTEKFKTIFELVKSDGNVLFSAANNKIYTGTATLTAAVNGTVTNAAGTGTTAYTITDDNWQVASMPYNHGGNTSSHAVFAQLGHPILVYHKLGNSSHNHTGSYGFQRLGDVGTLPAAYTVTTFTPDCALTAYGRLWVANITGDNQTIYFSDLQDPSNFTTGTSGYLDISTVIPTGDGIVALAAHNGFLIIFCHRSILVYASPKDPSTMTLSDVIKGFGCIARDSVVSVYGSDIMFLSETGVQSLGRLIQEKSMPLRDVSKNVRDDLIANVATETLKDIKAVYYAPDAFYLLSLPSTGFTYCFDTRGMLENGAARTTIWKEMIPRSFCVTEDKKLYIGKTGYIGYYNGYLDNDTTYRWSYYTNYFDFEQPTSLKILKKLGLVVIGGGNQDIAIKWGFDYTNNYNSSVVSLDTINTIYEYGTAEYGIAEYSNGIVLDVLKFNASGSGRVLQIGFESDIIGYPLSIQKVDVAMKTGKNI
jgi:hypothetical protein